MVFVFAMLFKYGLYQSGRKYTSTHLRRMLLSYLQISTLLSSIGIQWPSSVKFLFNIQSAISTIGDHVLKVDCLMPSMNQAQMVYSLSIAYFFSPFVVVMILCLCIRVCMKKQIDAVRTRWDSMVKGIVLIMYMCYPSLCRQAFSILHCIKFSGECIRKQSGHVVTTLDEETCELVAGYYWRPSQYFLYLDMEEVCWEGRHMFYFWLVGIPQVLLHVIGIPLFGLIIIYRAKRFSILDDSTTLYRYGLLYDGYKKSSWWWQGFIAYSKGAIVILCYILARVPTLALHCVTLLLAIMILIENMVHPWKQVDIQVSVRMKPNNKRRRQSFLLSSSAMLKNVIHSLKMSTVSNLSLFVCLFTSWSGYYFEVNPRCRTDGGCMTLVVVVLSAHGLFFSWAVYTVVKEMLEEGKRKKRKRGKKQEESGRITIMNPLHKKKQNASARSIEMINRLENIHRVEDTVSKHRNIVSNIERVDDEIHIHTNEHDEEIEHVVPTYKFTL